MDAIQLLVLLTLNANGLPSAAFVHADSPQQCELRRAMLGGMLTGSGIQLIDSRCIESERRFTPYRHDAPGPRQPSVWLIDLQARPPRLEPMADRESCLRARPQSASAVCAVSDQREAGWRDRLREWLMG